MNKSAALCRKCVGIGDKMQKNRKRKEIEMSRKKALNEMRLEFLSDSRNESFARSTVCAFASQLDPTVGELTEIRTAVSEAVTNAIIHGYRGRSGIVKVSASYSEGGVLRVRISDKGCGIADIERAREPLFTSDESGERGGIGFSIMESFTDRMTVRSAPEHGTTVTLIKRIGQSSNAD